jgi:hypothetical protein
MPSTTLGRAKLAGAVLAATVLAIGLCSAAGPAAAASAPAWRIVWASSGSAAESLDAVEATSTSDAWAGGSAGTGSAARPVVVHWNGHVWRQVSLPSGLAGTIRVLRATSSRNVWAFGDDTGTGTSFALRWNGKSWKVMHKWTKRRMLIGDAAVLSASDVWIFSATRDAITRYNGKGWVATFILGAGSFLSVRAFTDQNIWALSQAPASDGTGSSLAFQGGYVDGSYQWTLGAFLVDPPELTTLYAQSPDLIWAVGGGTSTGNNGEPQAYPLVARYADGTWTEVYPGADPANDFILSQAVSDGAGGLWATTTSFDDAHPRLVHFVSGAFSGVTLHGTRASRTGVYGIADIPGTARVWAAGTRAGTGGKKSDGVIIEYAT